MTSSFSRRQQRTPRNSRNADAENSAANLLSQSWSFIENGRQAFLGYTNNRDNKDDSYGKHPPSPQEDENGIPYNAYGDEDRNSHRGVIVEESKATTIAACFLKDFLAGRPHVFNSNITTITNNQLALYKVRYSKAWKVFGLYPAALLLFITAESKLCHALLHTYSAIIFLFDIYIGNQLSQHSERKTHPFDTQHHLVFPLLVFLVIYVTQNWACFFLAKEEREYSKTISSLFKPIVLFYLSRHARHALESLGRASKFFLRVILMEMFLILSFATIACRLYYGEDNFEKLSTSWLSLFQLSTTVVSPSLWMSMYNDNRTNAWFFVIFIVICVFYLHSLILAVVFQVFIQSASEVHERSLLEQERTIKLAFHALQSANPKNTDEVETSLVRSMLQKVRPHYNGLKMNVLMEIFDPMSEKTVDYATFRNQSRLSLNSSIRKVRANPFCDTAIQVFSIVITAINFIYVILLTSVFHQEEFGNATVGLGFALSIAGMFELVLRRFNPLKMKYYPISGSNSLFDAIAFGGATVSIVGMCIFLGGHEHGANIVLIGRTIDMFRMMRFFSVVRDVVERSQQILPALAGPGILIFTSVHIFVYFGMALWGGAIDTYELSSNEDIEPYYYLNNFNSYSEGLVTVFNVLVVNDWHQIAKVFLYASRNNGSFVVYAYFIMVVVVGVVILLNVVTAFFVETYVVKLNKEDLNRPDLVERNSRRDFSIQSTASSEADLSSLQRVWSQPLSKPQPKSSNSSDTGELIEFDVFERKGFNDIMSSIGSLGENDGNSSFAKSIRDVLELISLPSWQSTEYLIVCGQSMDRFSTNGYPSLVGSFMTEQESDSITVELIQKLKSSDAMSKRLFKQFVHEEDPRMMLELLALGVPSRKLVIIVAKLERKNL